MKKKNHDCFICGKDTSKKKGSAYKVYQKNLLRLLSQRKQGAKPGIFICKRCELRIKREGEMTKHSSTNS